MVGLWPDADIERESDPPYQEARLVFDAAAVPFPIPRGDHDSPIPAIDPGISARLELGMMTHRLELGSPEYPEYGEYGVGRRDVETAKGDGLDRGRVCSRVGRSLRASLPGSPARTGPRR